MPTETDPSMMAPGAVREAAPESAKRKQILDGARRVFFNSGFVAASMGEIAREAGVSKGTLYVYFDSKEALFAALVEESKRATAERMLVLDPDDPDVAGALTAFIVELLDKMVKPDHVAMVRMVIGISDKFPGLARILYEAGPDHGRRQIATYLAAQRDRGRLSITDPETAAWQFLGMCCHPVTVRLLLSGEPPPDAAQRRHYADSAVEAFLAAH